MWHRQPFFFGFVSPHEWGMKRRTGKRDGTGEQHEAIIASNSGSPRRALVFRRFAVRFFPVSIFVFIPAAVLEDTRKGYSGSPPHPRPSRAC